MLVSTKGRYALRVMLDLAEHNPKDYVILMEIAERQELSEKYLESILSTLSKAGFVEALRGRGGGYRLAKPPSDYTVGSILKAVEGSLAPVSCLGNSGVTCTRAADCDTLPLWKNLDLLIDGYLEKTTLTDLLNHSIPAVNCFLDSTQEC